MSGRSSGSHPAQRRYPPEPRERAVRMVFEAMEASGESFGVITRIARQLDIGSESLRNRVRQAQVDGGQRPGTTSEEAVRIKELEREVGRSFLRGGARPPTDTVIAYIDAHRGAFGVEPICRVLQVAPSTYYAAKT